MKDYKDYEADIMFSAWKFAFSLNEYEDLLSCGMETFFETARLWEEKKMEGCFRAYLRRCLRNRMRDLLRAWKVRRDRNESIDAHACLDLRQLDDTWNPERLLSVNVALGRMSKEAKEAVRIILSSPEEILSQAKNLNPKSLRGQVARTLHGRGWKWAVIYSAMREIKDVVKTF